MLTDLRDKNNGFFNDAEQRSMEFRDQIEELGGKIDDDRQKAENGTFLPTFARNAVLIPYRQERHPQRDY